MTPQQEPPQATEAKPLGDKELFAQMLEQAEQDNPYGRGKYTDDDAVALGLPSLGSMRLARQMVKDWYHTPVMPKWIKDSPNPAGTFVATVVRGRELGFKMLEAIQSMYLSPDGKLGLYGTAMLALMRRSGMTIKFTDIEENGVVVGVQAYGKRKDGDEYTARFTRADAQRAGLVKGGGAHEKYPIVMCTWRSASILFRVLASDLAGGPLYSAEELFEEGALDKIVAETELRQSAEPEKAKLTIGRKSKKIDPAAAPSSASAAGEGDRADIPAEAASAESPSTETVATEPAMNAESMPEVTESAPEPEPIVAKTVARESVQIPDKPGPQLVQPSPSVAGYMKALKAKLPEAKLQDYLRGFLDITKIPATHADLEPALAFLTSMDPTLVLRDPHRAGADAGVGYRSLVKFTKNWGTACQQLAFAIALDRYATSGGGDLKEYLEGDPIFAENMLEGDLTAFLRVLQRVPGNVKLASTLREATIGNNGNLAIVVAEWEEAGMDLNTCTADDIESAVQLLEPSSAATSIAEALEHAHDPEDLFSRMRT